MVDFNAMVTAIETLLEQEKKAKVSGYSDLQLHKARRTEIQDRILILDKAMNEVIQHSRRLPTLPNEDIMDWAEAMLDMQNLAILVLDTTGVQDDSDIIRVHATSQYETFLDIIVQPQRQKQANTRFTGISQDTLDQAPTLAEAWDTISRELRGHYIVAYNLPFVEGRLKDNIDHYGLSRLPLRGECLMEQANTYFQIGHYTGIKLPEACQRIGYKMATPSLAPDRAAGQLALLRAMSHGITEANSVEIEDEDEHPF